MPIQINRKKWILYRHTRSFKIISTVAELLKYYTQSSISDEDKVRMNDQLRESGLYSERNPEVPFDSINHRINTLAYYMFGYKGKVGNQKKFLFSPLGNLFLAHINDSEKLSKIFLTMIWGIQFQHPHSRTPSDFHLYPFRLLYRLLHDSRLDNKLYSFEVAYIIVFIETIDTESYENLVGKLKSLRALDNSALKELFEQDPHAYVNSAYEWDYYVSELFVSAGILGKQSGNTICRLKHGNTNTFRSVTRNYVYIPEDLISYCQKLENDYPFTDEPLALNDPERLTIDIVKEIYSFYPNILLEEIGEEVDELKAQLLELPRLIERYANNNEGEESDLFEEILTDGFNMFFNIEAKRIGGPGSTDIECLFLTKRKTFAVDAKSTKNKLALLNAGRLKTHREKIGGEYTIIVTPRYVPAVKHDIESSEIVIILAGTFSEYLYNYIMNDERTIDYSEIDNIIIDKLGEDISPYISNLTLEKFGAART